MKDDLEVTPAWGDSGSETLPDPQTTPTSRPRTSAGRPAIDLTPGAVLGERYRIVNRLGKGGMGEVFRADDLKLDLPVALKFLPPELAADEARHAQLFEEIKVARKISHPNVCRVYDLGETDGLYFLSMEYIDGEDLKSLLHRIGRLPWSKSIELARQVCDGLAAAHDAGVLHRDLKPANLMIDGEGRARVTDFGLAALADGLSADAGMSGTPLYMAPEQFSGRPASTATDVYALGLVLYELFTGQRVIEASSLAEAMKLHQKGIPTRPSELRFGFDSTVEELILRCLEKDPKARPDSVAEIGAAIGEAAAGGLAEGAQVATVLGCDLVEASDLSERLSDSSAGAVAALHDRVVRDLASEFGGREISKSDAFLLLFQRPLEAVRFALAYHRRLAQLSAEKNEEMIGRVAIHLGEVVVRRNAKRDVERGASPLEIEGFARPMTARLLALAAPKQTLLTRGAFDVARRSARGEIDHADELRWLAHGEYLFQGSEEPSAVFEVGLAQDAPLAPPEGGSGAQRISDEGTILGWRPGPGLQVPQRPNWIVQRKLGEGGFGETWLVRHGKTGEERVYKFCYEQEHLFSLQREITVFRLLKEELGLRDDIARILDWNLEEAPYFLEFDHIEGGSLLDWAQTRGGIDQVPLEERLEIAAQVATALAAAHSVGVLHKDIKPGNVLIKEGTDGAPKAVLTDFGIGMITDQQRLAAKGITVLGMTQMEESISSGSTTGTLLYLAPELQAGQTATIQADIYALGIMLYQLSVGDLGRPMPHGWTPDVGDEILREDIAACVDGKPSRRPGSAAEVAERLRRLEQRRSDREAEARRRAEAERAQRRRRVLAVTAAVSTVFLIVVSFLAIQAIRARSDAERRRAQAETLIDFMLTDLAEGLDRIGRLDLLADVARSSQAHFESLSARDETPEALLQRGTTLQNIGQVLLDQGDAAAARASQESAIELIETIGKDNPDAPGWKRALSLARLRLGNALRVQGDTDASLAAYRASLEEAKALVPTGANDLEALFLVAQGHFRLAFLQRNIGDAEAALQEAEAALGLLQTLTADDRADWRQHLLLVDTHALLAQIHRFNGSIDAALDEATRARDISQRLQIEDPGNSYWPRRLAGSYSQIGNLLYFKRDLEKALEAALAARGVYRTLAQTDPTRVEWPEQLAFTSQMAGFILSEMGQPARALDLYDESIEIVEDLLQEDPERPGWLRKLADGHQIIGLLHSSQGRAAAAAESLATSIHIMQKVVAVTGDDPAPRNVVSWLQVLLGDIFASGKEMEKARDSWERAVEGIEPITAVSDTRQYRDTHAQALMRLGRLEEARPIVEGLLTEGWDKPDFLELVRSSGLDAEVP